MSGTPKKVPNGPLNEQDEFKLHVKRLSSLLISSELRLKMKFCFFEFPLVKHYIVVISCRTAYSLVKNGVSRRAWPLL